MSRQLLNVYTHAKQTARDHADDENGEDARRPTTRLAFTECV